MEATILGEFGNPMVGERKESQRMYLLNFKKLNYNKLTMFKQKVLSLKT